MRIGRNLDGASFEWRGIVRPPRPLSPIDVGEVSKTIMKVDERTFAVVRGISRRRRISMQAAFEVLFAGILREPLG